MKIIHIMKNGTVRDSVDGIKIPCGEFYQVFNAILEKQRKESNK